MLMTSVQCSVSRCRKRFFLSVLLVVQFLGVNSAAKCQEKKGPTNGFNCSAQNGCQSNGFFEKHAEGWHWYEDSIQKPEGRDQKKEEQFSTEKIEAQRKNLEQKLHTAIVKPTRENIIAYIITQKALMDQSQRFSEAWQRVVMTTPSLDETLIYPVDQNARHVYYSERNKEITKRIKDLSQEYGLFFFFRKTCPYCHHFAPVVKHFAEKYGWSVLAISLDGGALPEFPYARHDNGIALRLQVTHVPALIALHPQSGQTIPLAYGLISESEIENRVELLTSALDLKGIKK